MSGSGTGCFLPSAAMATLESSTNPGGRIPWLLMAHLAAALNLFLHRANVASQFRAVLVRNSIATETRSPIFPNFFPAPNQQPGSIFQRT